MRLFGTIVTLINRRIFGLLQKVGTRQESPKLKTFLQDNAFLSFNDFCNKFKIKANFFKYYGLCHVVPQKWTDVLKRNVAAPSHDGLERVYRAGVPR